MDRPQLRRTIERFFDEEELRTLAFDLGIDYDSLRGEGHSAKVREFCALVFRHQRELELLRAIATQRPHNQFWADALATVRKEQLSETGEYPALRRQQTGELYRMAMQTARALERINVHLKYHTIWLAIITILVVVASLSFAMMMQ